MQIDENILNETESISLELRSLYAKYGYSQYKMSKFEEYDFYSQNKDFLVSDTVITFTDTSGKLMALKPDVTLSIIKNSDDSPEVTQKVCYNENVYRVSKKADGFKEIMQVGLEAFGDIDSYTISEVLLLAYKSLGLINEDFILDISNLDILNACIDKITKKESERKKILKFISEKNSHELTNFINELGCEPKTGKALLELVEISDSPSVALPVVKRIAKEAGAYKYYINLKNAVDVLGDEKTRIDFSLINDSNYYNGITFRGFIKNIPESVLSGGQYDLLLAKMKRNSKAIGFAVYLDTLEDLQKENEYDVDAYVLYDSKSNVEKKIKQIVGSNKKVFVSRSLNKKIKYKELIDLRKEGK